MHEDGPEEGGGRSSSLRRIAEALGRHPDSFVDDVEGDQTLRLLQLWSALTDASSREAALEALQIIVEQPKEPLVGH